MEKLKEQLSILEEMTKEAEVRVSFFVPLRWTEIEPQKIFQSLVIGANKLLGKAKKGRIQSPKIDFQKFKEEGAITLAVYLTDKKIHFIGLNIRLEPRFIVANSFHVKPLIASADCNYQALMLHFNTTGAHLYKITMTEEKLLESFLPDRFVMSDTWPDKLARIDVSNFLEHISSKLKSYLDSEKLILGVTGKRYEHISKLDYWQRFNLKTILLDDDFSKAIPNFGLSIMRLKLARAIDEKRHQEIQKILLDLNYSKKYDLDSLGKSLRQNKIKKLYVSLDHLQFGSINEETGELFLHRSQQDVRDDDIFDDLVELAIKRGTEVKVLPKNYFPDGVPFLAV